MQAYCMKCRAKREMKQPRSITMENGRPATQGVCPVCGTKMFRMGESKPSPSPSTSPSLRPGPEFPIHKMLERGKH